MIDYMSIISAKIAGKSKYEWGIEYRGYFLDCWTFLEDFYVVEMVKFQLS